MVRYFLYKLVLEASVLKLTNHAQLIVPRHIMNILLGALAIIPVVVVFLPVKPSAKHLLVSNALINLNRRRLSATQLLALHSFGPCLLGARAQRTVEVETVPVPSCVLIPLVSKRRIVSVSVKNLVQPKTAMLQNVISVLKMRAWVEEPAKPVHVSAVLDTPAFSAKFPSPVQAVSSIPSSHAVPLV
jgi:hypothetical protein